MFFRLFDAESDLEDGVFGTRHPNAHKRDGPRPDLVVAPLAAFDRGGDRIGYGAGYYDRAIADLAGEGPSAPPRRHRLRLPGGSRGAGGSRTTGRCDSIATERELIRTEAQA